MSAHTDFIQTAVEAIATEKDALDVLMGELDDRFNQACRILLACKGRVVVTGMGKSGHIGRKIAATLASTGTPAFFVHPGEAGHGDLGMLTRADALLAISNSGQSDEIALLLPTIKRLEIPLISISRTKDGVLPKAADVALSLGQSKEACPLGLAPTSSTTATLALGDALAIALLQARGFSSADFALSHPAGALGRKLLLRARDLMRTCDLPVVAKETPLRDTLLAMTSGRLGLAVVADKGRVVGVFTDGDLRRRLEIDADLDVLVGDIMTRSPKTIDGHAKAEQALERMNATGVNQLLILDNGRLQGVLTLRDLVEAGLAHDRP